VQEENRKPTIALIFKIFLQKQNIVALSVHILTKDIPLFATGINFRLNKKEFFYPGFFSCTTW
jgi:hypothetical protein